ncbi:MAG: hypothetical protein IT233_13985 [Bacteroidia bacterium]|nr:hypothetical protein [Bacteroidia bacterium]
MYDILKRFEDKVSPLKKKGLKVEGLQMVDPKKRTHVINISRPFIFDMRGLPKKYEGLSVKGKINGDLPNEFQIDRTKPDWMKRDYIWAPERFEKFVERCGEQIRKELGNPVMTKKEMLDALCFGNYEEHKKNTKKLIKEGKIPSFKGN